MQHNGTDAIEEFMHYPGSAIVSILEHALTNDFWQSDLLNVNFPPEIATEVRMTKLLPQLKEIYDYESNKTDNTKLGGQFKYTGGRTAKSNRSLAFDVAAVDAGYISITPCKFDYLDESAYEHARNVAFPL